MRMEIGRVANTVKFFDDAGREVIIPCREIKLHLKYNEATSVDLLGVSMDKIVVDVKDDLVRAHPTKP